MRLEADDRRVLIEWALRSLPSHPPTKLPLPPAVLVVDGREVPVHLCCEESNPCQACWERERPTRERNRRRVAEAQAAWRRGEWPSERMPLGVQDGRVR